MFKSNEKKKYREYYILEHRDSSGHIEEIEVFLDKMNKSMKVIDCAAIESLQKENAELKEKHEEIVERMIRRRVETEDAIDIAYHNKKHDLHNEIHTLKVKLLTFEGMTFSDSDLKIKLDKAVECLKITADEGDPMSKICLKEIGVK
jgi:hypothetical protein